MVKKKKDKLIAAMKKYKLWVYIKETDVHSSRMAPEGRGMNAETP